MDFGLKQTQKNLREMQMLVICLYNAILTVLWMIMELYLCFVKVPLFHLLKWLLDITLLSENCFRICVKEDWMYG